MSVASDAYILHIRPYRETSSLIEALTAEHGVVPLVGRGVKRLQTFVPLSIAWVGRGELVTLTRAEPLGIAFDLTGKALICGLYLNELLVKLLQKWDESPSIFMAYSEAIVSLSASTNDGFSAILRKFEKQLLHALGYAWHLDDLESTRYYEFDPIAGLIACDYKQHAISGGALIALSQDDFSNAKYMQEIKYLMRKIFAYYLGNKKILSRELF